VRAIDRLTCVLSDSRLQCGLFASTFGLLCLNECNVIANYLNMFHSVAKLSGAYLMLEAPIKIFSPIFMHRIVTALRHYTCHRWRGRTRTASRLGTRQFGVMGTGYVQ